MRLDVDVKHVGGPEGPVKGSGVFIGGAGTESGGTVVADDLRQGAIHADNDLPAGTTGTAAGGIFILPGAWLNRVSSRASVVTHSANAVPLDNWGEVERWDHTGNATSFGPSAIGVINAGTIGTFDISGTIETFGEGARGCGIYGPVGRDWHSTTIPGSYSARWRSVHLGRRRLSDDRRLRYNHGAAGSCTTRVARHR